MTDNSIIANGLSAGACCLIGWTWAKETFISNFNECFEMIKNDQENQFIEKYGTLVRKKLDFGVYRSINHTFSLFIEPQDILKKLDSDEYEEYVLFPNGIDMIDSYFIIKNNRLVA